MEGAVLSRVGAMASHVVTHQPPRWRGAMKREMRDRRAQCRGRARRCLLAERMREAGRSGLFDRSRAVPWSVFSACRRAPPVVAGRSRPRRPRCSSCVSPPWAAAKRLGDSYWGAPVRCMSCDSGPREKELDRHADGVTRRGVTHEAAPLVRFESVAAFQAVTIEEWRAFTVPILGGPPSILDRKPLTAAAHRLQGVSAPGRCVREHGEWPERALDHSAGQACRCH